jgi:hypothetical protein
MRGNYSKRSNFSPTSLPNSSYQLFSLLSSHRKQAAHPMWSILCTDSAGMWTKSDASAIFEFGFVVGLFIRYFNYSNRPSGTHFLNTVVVVFLVC